MTGTSHTTGVGFNDLLDTLAGMLDADGVAPAPQDTICRRPADAPVPLSFSQELVWLLHRAMPGLTAYNFPISRRVRGPLDRDALQHAIDLLAARHEILRTRLVDHDGGPRQIIDMPASVPLRIEDVSTLPANEREAAARRIVRERGRAPFDLAREHAFRPVLIRLDDTDHVLLLELHHIAVDGWSLGVLLRELDAGYAAARRGATPSLADPAIQYGDYAAWQRRHVSGDRLATLLAFWRQQLGDATEPLGLPTDFPRSQVPSFEGARESVFIDTALLASIRAMAKRADATLYMVLLTAYGIVLHRYTGRDDVLIGSGSAGRMQPELEALVGYVNNTLVQRVDVSGNPPLAQLLARVRTSALDAYDHQDIPLEKLVLELRRGDDRASHAPLFDVVLTMQDVLQSTFALDGLTVESFGADLGATKFDITLLASERDGGLWLTSQYRSELFAAETMRAFLGHVVAVLRAMVSDIEQCVSDVPLLTAEERSELASWRATDVDEGSVTTVVRLVESQAARVPTRDAVQGINDDGSALESLTYRELNARANQLARHLHSLGVERGRPVGLLIDRSSDAIVGLLGILKAGGAYVPLAADAPAVRIARQLDECDARVAVTMQATRALLPQKITSVALDGDAAALAALSPENVQCEIGEDDLAYILYTSGSTGTPKGVAVTHANVLHYARAISRVLADVAPSVPGDGFAALDGWRFAVASSLSTDLGNTSVFPALLAGATLQVLPSAVATSPAHFASYVADNRPDVLKMTPSHVRALIGDPASDAQPLPSRWLVLGGEALSWDLASRVREAGRCRVLNHYGPTETTVGVATYEVRERERSDARTVPIGRALANTRLYVVDAYGNEAPIGIPGELVIAGAGVSRGYLNDATLTAQRFVAEPMSSAHDARAYRTGDRVRQLRDGAIEFLGRLDDQVKIHGYRVEPADVESALRRYSGVADCAIVARSTTSGDTELLAFVVPATARYGSSGHVAPDDLRDWVRGEVPAHMVPSQIVVLDALPRTASGKVDRRALTAHVHETSTVEAYVAPTTETETRIAEIWCEVLKRDRVGATEDFIALGGHSLLAIRVLGKLSRAFGVRLPLRALFDAPTVRQLAEVVDLELQLAALESMSEEEAARLLASPGDGEVRR